jgi:hypothetical protein
MATLHLSDTSWQKLSRLATLHHCDPADCAAQIIAQALEDEEDYALGMQRLSESSERYTLAQVINNAS